jgi:transcriptional regulator with XRE-family HTH domain
MNNPVPGDVPPTLGKRIAECRERLNWTQKKLADEAKISVTFLSELENDHRMPGAEIVLRIADVIGVSVDYLLRGQLNVTAPTRAVVVPPALVEAAEEQGWSFSEALDLLKAHQLVIARRSRSGISEISARLSKNDWLDMHRRWFEHEGET